MNGDDLRDRERSLAWVDILRQHDDPAPTTRQRAARRDRGVLVVKYHGAAGDDPAPLGTVRLDAENAAHGPKPGWSCRLGAAPGASHGVDVDEAGSGTVTGQRLYQLVRQSGPVADHTVEITVQDPGVQAYRRPETSG